MPNLQHVRKPRLAADSSARQQSLSRQLRPRLDAVSGADKQSVAAPAFRPPRREAVPQVRARSAGIGQADAHVLLQVPELRIRGGFSVHAGRRVE